MIPFKKKKLCEHRHSTNSYSRPASGDRAYHPLSYWASHGQMAPEGWVTWVIWRVLVLATGGGGGNIQGGLDEEKRQYLTFQSKSVCLLGEVSV